MWSDFASQAILSRGCTSTTDGFAKGSRRSDREEKRVTAADHAGVEKQLLVILEVWEMPAGSYSLKLEVIPV